MQIIRQAFNPEGGNARAACENIDDRYAVGLIVKGDDADAIIAKFREQVPTIDLSANWSGLSDLFDSLETNSPVIMFCRNTHEAAERNKWMDCFYKNIGESPLDRSEMVGVTANIRFDKPEVVGVDNIIEARFRFYRNVILISSAPYDKKCDTERLIRSLERAYIPLCNHEPEEHWQEVGEVLRNELGKDNAYIFIANADFCRERAYWNLPAGEPTKHRLKIDWRKKGWSIGQDYDEHISDVVNARTGAFNYESFEGLCITSITDDAITVKLDGKTQTLTHGNTLVFRDGDSYEDHEGVEHYDITYILEIEWLKE